MGARRALLYTPGDEMTKIRKAATLGVDCVCMDLEDGVAANHKKIARETIAEALERIDFTQSERLVRINPVGSSLVDEDLSIILPAKPDGIVIPKVESREQISWVSEKILKVEKEQGWTIGEIVVIAIVETALSIVNLKDIATSDSRLNALIFGAEDLAASIGAHRSQSGWEIFHARSAVVTHAAAFSLQAIDMVYIDFNDTEGLLVQATQGAHLGYDGKQVIHPNQVDPVQEAFTPSDEEISAARDIIGAYESHQVKGKGAFAMDGRMIDAPLVKSARAVLERARVAGKN